MFLVLVLEYFIRIKRFGFLTKLRKNRISIKPIVKNEILSEKSKSALNLNKISLLNDYSNIYLINLLRFLIFFNLMKRLILRQFLLKLYNSN